MSYEINLNRYLDVVATYGKRYYHQVFLKMWIWLNMIHKFLNLKESPLMANVITAKGF